MNIAEQVCMLRCPNNRDAYRALQSLQGTSDSDEAVYAHIDSFIEMMRDSNSYVRTRGLALIACNAKWDEAGKIDGIIDEYLDHVTDVKPITARQCIKSLPKLAETKPHLMPRIVSSLRHADTSAYADSMRSLVQNDICDALLALDPMQ
ncbi:MAG TPA: hypothetical protein OIM11_04345 [Coriobacteriaceae bacterium]|nr:hypothetical protein [Coriobacteriaceae bacterium]